MLVQVLAAPFVTQLPDDVSEKPEEDGLRAWTPSTHMSDPGEVLGSWHYPGPALAVAVL